MKLVFLFLLITLSGCSSVGQGTLPDVKKALEPIFYNTKKSPNDFFYCLAPKFDETGHFPSYRVSPTNSEGEMVVRVPMQITSIVTHTGSKIEVRIASLVYPSWPGKVKSIVNSCL